MFLNNTIADELKRDLEDVAYFKGSRAEQLLMVFCKQTKLRITSIDNDNTLDRWSESAQLSAATNLYSIKICPQRLSKAFFQISRAAITSKIPMPTDL